MSLAFLLLAQDHPAPALYYSPLVLGVVHSVAIVVDRSSDSSYYQFNDFSRYCLPVYLLSKSVLFCQFLF